jgi:hypothetical protein
MSCWRPVPRVDREAFLRGEPLAPSRAAANRVWVPVERAHSPVMSGPLMLTLTVFTLGLDATTDSM